MNATASGATRDRRTAVIEATIDIAQPAGVVFGYCSDHRNEIEWNPAMRRVAKATDGPVGAAMTASPSRTFAQVRSASAWQHEQDLPDPAAALVDHEVHRPEITGPGYPTGGRTGSADRRSAGSPEPVTVNFQRAHAVASCV